MDKALNLLGLAKRSGHLICGTDSVISSLQKNKLHLIVLAADASFNTKDKLIKKAYFYQIKVIEAFDSNTLKHATGTNNLVFGLDDEGFSKSIKKEIFQER